MSEAGVHVGDDLLLMALNAKRRRLHKDDVIFIGVDPDYSKVKHVRETAILNGLTNVVVHHGALGSNTQLGKHSTLEKVPNSGAWKVIEAAEASECSFPFVTIDSLLQSFTNFTLGLSCIWTLRVTNTRPWLVQRRQF